MHKHPHTSAMYIDDHPILGLAHLQPPSHADVHTFKYTRLSYSPPLQVFRCLPCLHLSVAPSLPCLKSLIRTLLWIRGVKPFLLLTSSPFSPSSLRPFCLIENVYSRNSPGEGKHVRGEKAAREPEIRQV